MIGAQIAAFPAGCSQIAVVPVPMECASVLVAVTPVVANIAIAVVDVTIIPPDIVPLRVGKARGRVR